ncbi:MAG: hypothetical protein MZV70_11440 [Desulfobacterales bacterium]|nr:hypothetical protein [Desulfobacterales bacterium]
MITYKIPVITIATKIDTISKNQATNSANEIAKTLHTEVIPFSAKTGFGKDKALGVLSKLINEPENC